MTNLRQRIERLEAAAPAPPPPRDAFILARVSDARRDGRGLLPDDEIICVRDTALRTFTQRVPGESVNSLCRRAALAGAYARHGGGVCVLMARYSVA